LVIIEFPLPWTNGLTEGPVGCAGPVAEIWGRRRVPARRVSAEIASGSRSLQQQQRRDNIGQILQQRELLVAEVEQLRANGASPLADKAQQLLTRWWAKADWAAREQLLRTARWLVQLEQNRRRVQTTA
jgi:hypothetical protein